MIWRGIWKRLAGRPRGLESELDEELASHMEMKERELREAGLSADAARSQARWGMGNLTLAREDARGAWAFQWLEDLGRDMRIGARGLLAQPGFAFAAIAGLTLGIGVNAIFFTVYNALAFAPWAVRNAERAVHPMVESTWRGRARFEGWSYPEYFHLREQAKSFVGLTAMGSAQVRVVEGEGVWNTYGMPVSYNFFPVLGTGFALGRGFSAGADDLRNPPAEAVLSHESWRDRYGMDVGVVGRWVEINGFRMQIVGVAVEGFTGPVVAAPSIWVPLGWQDKFRPEMPILSRTDACCAEVTGMLREGVSREAARAELETLSAGWRKSVGLQPGRVMLAEPTILGDPNRRRSASAVLVVLSIATGLILLLACANVANLQLARALARRREIAVRLSLGAGRGRILRQLMGESLLLSLLAGGVALAMSMKLPAMILGWVAAGESVLIQFQMDWRILTFTAGACAVAALLSGLAPAWTAVRDHVAGGLRETARTASGGRLRLILLTAQVALSAVLVGGAALLLRALDEARTVEPGFAYGGLIAVSPDLLSTNVQEAESGDVLGRLRERMAAAPGVKTVAHADMLPLGRMRIGGRVSTPASGEIHVHTASVSANFLETIGIPLLAGRQFTAAEEGRKDLAIVNEAMARRLWGGESALGKNFDADGRKQVIGVARDHCAIELGMCHDAMAYYPSRGNRMGKLVVRYEGDGAGLAGLLPRLAREMDKRLFATAERYEEVVDRARRAAGIAAAIAGALSILALGLAALGIFGVAGYHVSQRRREMGVRMALGATRGQIVGLVMGQNLKAVAAGCALGMAGTMGMGQMLSNLLYGVKASDPQAMGMALAILSAAALGAVAGPARRAAGLDPAEALRHE